MSIAFFISSSSEQLPVARALETNLAAEGHEPTLWSRGAHGASEYNLEALLGATAASDCAIFVFAPDDQVSMRGETHGVVRDNVLFELGVFVGALGRSSCFVVQRTDQPMQLPSDLSGVTTLPFSTKRSDGNLHRALGPATTMIVERAAKIAIAKESQLSDNDLRLLAACGAPSMPSNQAFKAFGAMPDEWDDKLCMRYLRLYELGLIACIGPTELQRTPKGALLANNSKRTKPGA